MKPSGISQDEITALFAQVGNQDAARPADFPRLDGSGGEGMSASSIGLLASVELEVSVLLGQARRNIREILSYGPGSILELDRVAGESVDVLINGRLVARGEVVVIGENFGVRILELIQREGGGEE